MGSRGRITGNVRAERRSAPSGCPFRCGEKTHQPLTSWQRSDRVTLRCVRGEHTAECKGEKGISGQPQAATPPAGGYGQGTKVRLKRRRGVRPNAPDGRAQTGNAPIRPWLSAPRVSARYEGHGVKYRPKATQNGHPERGNPSGALPDTGAGNQAGSPDGVGCPKKRRSRVMPGIG